MFLKKGCIGVEVKFAERQICAPGWNDWLVLVREQCFVDRGMRLGDRERDKSGNRRRKGMVFFWKDNPVAALPCRIGLSPYFEVLDHPSPLS